MGAWAWLAYYFTFWTLLLVCLGPWTARCLDLVYLALVTLVCGLWVSWFDPGCYRVPPSPGEPLIVLSGWQVLVADAIHATLLVAAVLFSRDTPFTATTKATGLAASVAVLLAYFVVLYGRHGSLRDVYGVRHDRELWLVGLLTTLAYLVYLHR